MKLATGKLSGRVVLSSVVVALVVSLAGCSGSSDAGSSAVSSPESVSPSPSPEVSAPQEVPAVVSSEADAELLSERLLTSQFAGFVSLVLNDVAANVPDTEPFPVVDFASAAAGLAVESMAPDVPQLVTLDQLVVVSQAQEQVPDASAVFEPADGVDVQVRFEKALCTVKLVPSSTGVFREDVPDSLVSCSPVP